MAGKTWKFKLAKPIFAFYLGFENTLKPLIYGGFSPNPTAKNGFTLKTTTILYH